MMKRSRPGPSSGGRSESGKPQRGGDKSSARKTGKPASRTKRFEKSDDTFENSRQKAGSKPRPGTGQRRSPGSATGSPRGVKKSFRRDDSSGSETGRPSSRKTPYRPFEKSKSDKPRRAPASFKERGTEKSKFNSKDVVVEKPTTIRLNKYISNSGVCSRREADELIKMGVISVNGKTITELGYKVNPGDVVRHESKVLKAEKPVYILLNKPKGFLTTTKDPQERNTVMHIIANTVKERVYPVGRLDRNTTGLLLLTNDGDLAEKLMHPSYNVKKIYRVELDRPLTKADAQKIVDGVQLDEGKAQVDDLAIISDDKKIVGLEIHIGWNRVVRRIFESLDYEVRKLDRSVYAGLDKKDLSRGQWRFLTREEVVRLKHYQ